MWGGGCISVAGRVAARHGRRVASPPASRPRTFCPGPPTATSGTVVNPSSLNGSLPAPASALPAPAGGAVPSSCPFLPQVRDRLIVGRSPVGASQAGLRSSRGRGRTSAQAGPDPRLFGQPHGLFELRQALADAGQVVIVPRASADRTGGRSRNHLRLLRFP